MKVFIAEDSIPIRARLKDIIEEVGGVVVGESDKAQEAVSRLLETCPDVAIVDLSLAEGSGVEVLRQVKKEKPGMTVVVLTNHNHNLYRRVCMELGADYFLDKGVDFPRFIDLMQALALRKRHENDDLIH